MSFAGLDVLARMRTALGAPARVSWCRARGVHVRFRRVLHDAGDYSRCPVPPKRPAVLPAEDVCRRARLSRDPRFDGRFVVGVLTTGVFCRPVCPARLPAEENVRYFATPAAALQAGYRPCLRCRPERARPCPPWTIASQTVIRALERIEQGFLITHAVHELASAIGVSARHLSRLFQRELGATPKGLARMQRLALARRLLDDTDLPISDVALCAGYGSLRRCNDEFRRVFGRAPRALRRRGLAGCAAPLHLRLPFRAPWRADQMFPFFARRALTGLERVSDHTLTRRLDGHDISVRLDGDALILSLPAALFPATARTVARTRQVFDLDANPAAIDGHLGVQPELAAAVRAMPGLRVPGTWDPFEGAVRAILGQQVRVDRAVVLATRLVEAHGDGVFPNPDALVDADVAAVGMPGARGRAVRGLARAILDQGPDFLTDPRRVRPTLLAIDGIGPWTAEYVAMRVAHDPDAFPAADSAVRKALGPKAAECRAVPWRPWRAYAVMYLWASGPPPRPSSTPVKEA